MRLKRNWKEEARCAMILMVNTAGPIAGRHHSQIMFYCGECGVPVNRRRLTSRKEGRTYKFTVWQCRLAARNMEACYECHSKYIWEEVIEQAFNQMLLKMTKEIGVVKAESESAIANVGLSKEENERLKELEKIIDRIGDQISEMSMQESVTKDPIYDATLRNLIYESQHKG